MRSHCITLVLVVVFVAAAGRASDDDCPRPPALVDRDDVTRELDPSRTLNPYSIYQTVTNYYDAPLGIGHLKVGDSTKANHYYDWMFEIDLPLWSQPDAARPLGWLVAGRLHINGSAAPLTGAGMVEVDYEHTNLIVWETANDWLKLKLNDKTAAWIPRCHLKSRSVGLEFQSWQTFFRSRPEWLHFRKPVPHRLRTSPDSDSERLTTIGLDHKLSLLEIQGDWMRVSVEQPDTTCGAETNTPTTRHEGWVKWRDDTGPWVYVYTRGC